MTFPWRIYKQDRHWVPPLIRDEKRFISPDHNPFFQHSEAEHFLAWRGRDPVGRIAAIHNKNHNQFHDERIGFFGLFESIDERGVAEALLDTAARWARDRGLTALRGPTNYSTNDTCGLLVEGFGSSPFIMMTYNPPYYETLLEQAGFRKAKDLLAYLLTSVDMATDRAERLERALRERRGALVRPMRKKEWDAEVSIVRRIYNQAWERNWCFVPFTPDEFDHMASSMKQIVDPHLVGILEVHGEPVGFGLALPDVNLALKHANGRLFPFGLLRILWASRSIKRMRVPILGILEEHRGKGYDVLLYLHLFRSGTARGYRAAETSWILEDNDLMRRGLENIGARVYRTYRMYERATSE